MDCPHGGIVEEKYLRRQRSSIMPRFPNSEHANADATMTKSISGSRFNWGDDIEEDGSAPMSLEAVGSMERLPTRSETLDPSTGIRTITSYSLNDSGQTVKMVRKTCTACKPVRVNKHVLRRRTLPKFGDCRNQTQADEKNVTYAAYDEIHLVLAPKRLNEEEKPDDLLSQLQNQGSVVVCRLCGMVGDHWTLKCPRRNAPPVGEAPPSETGPEPSGGATGIDGGEADGAGGSNRYVPPNLRAGASRGMGGSSRMDRDDLPTIRLSNLSEDATEHDLNELCSNFGHVMRIRLAKDRASNLSKGYAFISYTHSTDAQAAIDRLNGYGYDNLILRAEWSRSMMQLIKEREADAAAASTGQR